MSDNTTFVSGAAIDALRRAHEAERKRLCLENDFRSYRAASQFQIEQNILLREKVYDLSARVEKLEKVRAAARFLINEDAGVDDPVEDGWWEWEKNCEALRAALKEAKP